MSKNILSERRQALENKFFREHEARLLSQQRQRLVEEHKKIELQTSLGIEDETLLAMLVSLGVTASDLCALSLVPLIRVAWADGTRSDKERSAILQAAVAQDITEESPSYSLLESWLSHAPTDELFDAWVLYLQSLLSHMSESDRTTLKESILGLAHDVASATGGILGIASISASETAALTAISNAFE